MCSGNGPLHLLFIWKCLHFLPYFSDSFATFRVSGWHFFPLALWLYPLAAFYLPEFLDEKFAENLTGDSVYVMICFSLAAFKILLSFGFQLFNYNVSQFIELLRCCYLCLSSDAEVWGSLFFQIFSYPFLSPTSFWDSYNGILIHLMVSHRSLVLPLYLRQ